MSGGRGGYCFTRWLGFDRNRTRRGHGFSGGEAVHGDANLDRAAAEGQRRGLAVQIWTRTAALRTEEKRRRVAALGFSRGDAAVCGRAADGRRKWKGREATVCGGAANGKEKRNGGRSVAVLLRKRREGEGWGGWAAAERKTEGNGGRKREKRRKGEGDGGVVAAHGRKEMRGGGCGWGEGEGRTGRKKEIGKRKKKEIEKKRKKEKNFNPNIL